MQCFGDIIKRCFQVFFHVFLSCVNDYLELRDGSTSEASLISRLCGNTRPSTQHSRGSSMLVRFRTDSSFMYKGFKAKYSIGRQIRVIKRNMKMIRKKAKYLSYISTKTLQLSVKFWLSCVWKNVEIIITAQVWATTFISVILSVDGV